MGSERFNAAGERLENPRPKPTSLWTRCFSQGPPYYVDLSLCVGCSICLCGPLGSIDPRFRQGPRSLFTGTCCANARFRSLKKCIYTGETLTSRHCASLSSSLCVTFRRLTKKKEKQNFTCCYFTIHLNFLGHEVDYFISLRS